MKFGPVKGEEYSSYTPAQLCLKWILQSPEVSTVVPSVNDINELQENLDTLSKEGEINESILEAYLKAIVGREAKEKIKEIAISDPNANIRFFAKRVYKNFS